MKREDLSESIDEQTLFLEEEDFDAAIIGVTSIQGRAIIAYDEEKVIECLMRRGMDHEDAIEWYEFNIACAYMGEWTPIYVRRPCC